MEIPVAISQKSASVTLDAVSVGASFAGVLNGAELQGSWTQGGATLPLVFRRAERSQPPLPQAAWNLSANCAPLPASSCLKKTHASCQGSAWTRSAQPFRSASE